MDEKEMQGLILQKKRATPRLLPKLLQVNILINLKALI